MTGYPMITHSVWKVVKDMKIDRRSTQPLYAQLKEWIQERIQNGTYKPGDQIPSEMALCKTLSLSRPTVRQAMAELVNEGILVIVKGKGTFVASEPDRIELKNIHAATFSFLYARSRNPLLDLDIVTLDANPEIDRLFGVTDDSHRSGYWSLSWHQETDNQRYVCCRSLIPVLFFPELGPDLKRGKKMIDITANKYAYLPQKASARILVRQAHLEESRILDIARSAPVLILTSRLKSRSGHVCEISTAVLRSDQVALGLDWGRS